MYRLAVMIVACGLALCLASCTCPECPESVECVDCVPDPALTEDLVSGCEDRDENDDPVGSPLVKAVIHLKGDAENCEARVESGHEEGLCVVQGGVIRWKVDNGCGLLEGSRENPAIEVTELFKVITAKDGSTAWEKTGWLFKECDPQITRLEAEPEGGQNRLLCDVPADAPVADYKYSLGGMIQPLDPPIRVRPPRGP